MILSTLLSDPIKCLAHPSSLLWTAPWWSAFNPHVCNLWQTVSACLITQSCLSLYDPLDYSLPGSSDHEIFQVRILEWVAISFFRGSSQPGIRPISPAASAMAGRFSTTEPLEKTILQKTSTMLNATLNWIWLAVNGARWSLEVGGNGVLFLVIKY